MSRIITIINHYKPRASWWLLCLLLQVPQVLATTIDSVRLWRAPDHTRVVLDMNDTVTYKVFVLDKPDRLVVDIDNTSNRASFKTLNFSNTTIKRIRSAARGKKSLRLVFDLHSPVKPRSFVLKPNKGKPHRLVLDLYDQHSATEKTVKTIAKPKAVAQQPTVTRRDIIVVVDAGHGGEDPGAIGPKRVKEKVVVLDIAKRLAKLLNQQSGYKAILTRDGDYFIPLRKRRDKARKARADLFVSVHADAFKHPQANGASVYALSQSGATSEAARFLAKQENEADLIGGVGDVSLDDKDEVLRGVLVDLSMTATVGASLDVGKFVLKDMSGIARLHKKHVEQAGFLVLKSPDVPSILVETGFISNPTEAKRLSSSHYRQKMAKSIFKGINSYFYRKPPAGTYVAWKKSGGKNEPVFTPKTPPKPKVATVTKTPATTNATSNTTSLEASFLTHKVKNGDNLSEIAQRYRVSVSKIKKLNRLKNNNIRIGQVLKISQKRQVVTRSRITHTVKNGETLSEIAQHYKTSATAIRKRNQLSSSVIRVGQVLIISN